MSIIIFIVVLVALIIVHEFGHFIAAKKLGMRVDEFGLGFPPRLWSKKKGETTYSINAIPAGGFVSIFGEDSGEDIQNSPDKNRAFSNRPRWAQAITLFAGVFFNVLFAWVLFSLVFSVGMQVPSTYSSPFGQVQNQNVTITDTLKNSPAKKEGLKKGDVITKLSTEQKSLSDISLKKVQSFISANKDKEITVTYKRDGELKTAEVEPQIGLKGIKDGKQAIGIMMMERGTVQLSPPLAIVEGARFTGHITYKIGDSFYNLISDAISGEGGLSQVAGPIGIIKFISKAYQQGFTNLLTFVAFISINLAIINLIPFPALDGGRLLFLGIEGTRRRNIKPQVTRTANFIGLVLLLLLMLVVTYNDIIRLLGH